MLPLKVELQPAFVLHSRPYRDTSLLLEVFSRDYGRAALVAKGVRKERSARKHLLQPFIPLLLSFSGRGDLKGMTAVEREAAAPFLNGRRLFIGMYLNELLMRLLPAWDAHHELFQAYRTLLSRLPEGEEEALLRAFELLLLRELGYGIDLSCEVSGVPLQADGVYRLDANEGFYRHGGVAENDPKIFLGADLLALAEENFSSPDTLRAAKRLTRQALAAHLGPRPLASRALFSTAPSS